jgi:PAS domain S-box-containing protein
MSAFLQRPRTRAEEAQRRQEQLIEFSRDAVITTDSHRRIITWNKGAEQMYGWPEREVVGKVLHQLLRTAGSVSPDEIDETLRREGQWDGELSHAARGGRRLEVESRQVLVSGANGAPAGILEINRDITQRKRAEEALRDSAERLRLAQQVAGVGTFEWHIQTDVNRWIPELEAMYGLAPGTFAGTERAWLELIHPEDRAEAARRDREAMDSGRFEAEWRTIQPDGTIRWVRQRLGFKG